MGDYKITLKDVFKKKKGVAYRKLLDETVLIDTTRGEIFSFNETAGVIWELLDGERDLGSIAGEISSEYDVDSDEAAGDVVEFISQLLEAELVEKPA